MKIVVIETRGGVIQEIYTDDREARVVVVDWNELEHVGNAVAEVRQAQPLGMLPPDTREKVEGVGLFGPPLA